MDMPYEPAGLAAEAALALPSAPKLARWVAISGGATLALAAGAGICAVLLVADALPSALAARAALVLALLALACGIAALIGRRRNAARSDRLDLLSEALASAPAAYLVAAESGAAVFANAAFARFFPGLAGPPLDALQRRIAAEEGALPDFLSLCRGLRQTGRADGHVAITHPLGPVAWYRVSAHALAGRTRLSLWSFEDVTERYAIERAMRDEGRKLADFLDHAPAGLYLLDGAGRFLIVNRTLADWLEASPVTLVAEGRKLADFFAAPPPADAPPHAPFADPERAEVTLRGDGGRLTRVLVAQRAVGSGASLRSCAVLRDLAQESDRRQGLDPSRERLERFFANAPVGIALLARDGVFAEANAALGALLGAEPQALIGRSLAEFLAGPEREAAARTLAAAAAGGAVPADPQALRFANGKAASLMLSRHHEGGLILHFIDTTEQKKIEAQFTQSQKMQAVGQLAGGVAHDFNNLLTAMIGFCDLLLLRHRAGDQSFADIMQIKQNANRAANLVRQLLAFSRRQALQPRVLDVTDALADLSHLLRRLIGENIELKVVNGRDLGLVRVDQGQLDQVIINLAVNARDAMPKGGTLAITTANATFAEPLRRGDETMPAGDYVAVEVADTGIGIAKENLERIFEPFFSTKEVGSGTGLGLSTVYGIVKQTGGFVLVESEEGRGTTFSIYLPRHQGAEAAAAPPRASEDALPRDLTGAGTVLLVEDEDPVRLFSQRALKNKGYSVIEAKSGEQALEILKDGRQHVDLVVTDVVMPKMDGPALIKAVRELFPERALKVIFISGYAEDNFRKRLGDETGIHFLSKPFSLNELATKVKDVMTAAR